MPIPTTGKPLADLIDHRPAEGVFQVHRDAYRDAAVHELEIRHLHEKIDHLLNRQWERLAEIQTLQIELLQDLRASRGPTA